jgi:enoyl-CoA hydratase/carnithine racemase
MIPDAGAIQRLPRRIPYNIAMEMLLLGRRMTAAEAQRYGLVNKVVPKDQLMSAARAWAEQLAEAAPLALQTVKEVLRVGRSAGLPGDAQVGGCGRGRARLRREAQAGVQGPLSRHDPRHRNLGAMDRRRGCGFPPGRRGYRTARARSRRSNEI